MRRHDTWSAVLLLGALACTGGLTIASPDLEAGEYNLETINGQALPFVLQFVDVDNRFEITAGTVTIFADGSFVDAAAFLLTQNAISTPQVDSTFGTWKQAGPRITFTPNDGSGAYTMSLVSDTRLLENAGNLSLSYAR